MHSRRIQEKVKEDYDKIASGFSATRHRSWPDFECFLPFFKGGSVLDLGCGNGRLIDFLQDKGMTEYLGVDQSAGLLAHARELHPKHDFIEADITSLELDRRFDVVFAVASFHHIPPVDQLDALIKWKKLLKDGGVLIMLNWNLNQVRFWSRLFRSLFSKFGWRGTLIPWKHSVMRYYYAFTRPRLARLLEQAELSLVMNEYIKRDAAAGPLSGMNILTVARS